MLVRARHRPQPMAVPYALALIATLSCGSPTDNAPRMPAAMIVISGDEQEATVGTELPDPLIVRVEDDAGRPVAGQLVNFRVVSGGGSMFAGSGLSNADGLVQDRWTLGTSTSVGQRVEARAVDPQTGAPLVFAVFTAIPRAGAPSVVSKHDGDEQEAAAGAPVPIAPAVLLVDTHGNPVAGMTVTFGTETEGSTITGGTVVTNAQGVAAVGSWTLRPQAGVNELTARVGDLPVVRFTATGRAGVAHSLRKIAGDEQTVGAGTEVPIVPRVAVSDAHGNILSQAGAVVTFSVTTGSGSVAVSSAQTDAAGEATPGSWTLGTVTGAHVLSASLSSGASVTFTATAVPRDTLLTKISGDEQRGRPLHELAQPIVVRVVDRYGNPVVGQLVSWTVAADDASIQTDQQIACQEPERPCDSVYGVTDAAGRVTARWTVGSGTFPRDERGGESQWLDAGISRDGQIVRQASFSATLDLLRATAVYSGEGHVCAVVDGGSLFCWGDNSTGQLGNGTTGTAASPVRASALTRTFATITLGGGHSCGLTAEGEAWCWGDNSSGQLGNGTSGGVQLTPTRVSANVVFRGIAAGSNHTCAFTREPLQYYPHWTGEIYCWGSNSSGQIRVETTELCSSGPCATVPQRLEGLASAPNTVHAGDAHSCVTTLQTQRYDTYCWGANDHGQLGTGDKSRLGSMRLGRKFTCALGWSDIGPRCWGWNTYGQVGNGSTQDVSNPTGLSGIFSSTYSLGTGIGDHTCMIRRNGPAWCWGRGSSGQIGTGQTQEVNPVPQPLPPELWFTSIGAGATYSCGRATTGAIYCWGTGPAIGQGSDAARRLHPTPVPSPEP